MKILCPRVCAWAGALITSLSVSAQPQMPGPGDAFNASLMKMFGGISAFSAQAEAQMLEKSSKDVTSLPMGFALLDGKIRMELDLAQMKSKQLPPEALAGMKQMGMDRMVNIVSPDKNQMIMIYPGLKAYADMALPNSDPGAAAKDNPIEKTAMGKETVDGHPCVKNKVQLTDAKGRKQDGFMWNATDLNDFPVKMEFADGDTKVTMLFKNIKLARPDAKQFDPPEGYAKHASVQDLMQSAMQKMMGGLGKPDGAKP